MENSCQFHTFQRRKQRMAQNSKRRYFCGNNWKPRSTKLNHVSPFHGSQPSSYYELAIRETRCMCVCACVCVYACQSTHQAIKMEPLCKNGIKQSRQTRLRGLFCEKEKTYFDYSNKVHISRSIGSS